MKNLLKIFILFLILISCSSKDKSKNLTLYQKAMIELKNGNISKSADMFEKIDDEEPFTKDSVNGLIMSSYSYYKVKDYENSIRVIDYFIESNPLNENIMYLSYLKCRNFYDRIKSANKSKDIIEDSDSCLKDFIDKYPSNNIYINDVLDKYKKTQTFLSKNEMNIAKFYLDKKNYLSAFNDYNNILKKYPDSEYIPEILVKLIEISVNLDLRLDAIQYYQLFYQKYKDNKLFDYSTKLIKKYEKI